MYIDDNSPKPAPHSIDCPNIASKKETPFIVSVSYQGYDMDRDKAIEKFARQFGGFEGGSGSNFVRRDVSLYFKTYIEALAFKDALPKSGLRVRFESIHYMASDGLYMSLDPVLEVFDLPEPVVPVAPVTRRRRI